MTNEKRKKNNNHSDDENTDPNHQGLSKTRLTTNNDNCDNYQDDEESLCLSLGRRPAKHRVLVPLTQLSSGHPSLRQRNCSSPLQTLLTHETLVTPPAGAASLQNEVSQSVQPISAQQQIVVARSSSSLVAPLAQPQVYCYDPLRSPPPPQHVPVHMSKQLRKNPTQVPKKEGKSEIVPVLYPWATNRRATILTFRYLMSQQILFATGEVQCKRCEKRYGVTYNIYEKFREIGSHICQKKVEMHERAPTCWTHPTLLTCSFCHQENSVKPVVADKKKAINWLFLFLGQMLGCCSLEQLKYFCKHTKNHRTGAKNRVLYLAYLGLCKQLDPYGPFDR